MVFPNRFPRFILPFLVLSFLFLVSALYYNQNKKSLAGEEVKAQEAFEYDVTLVCEGDEIPLGQLVDEVLASTVTIANNLEETVSAGTDQVAAARDLFWLPEQCKEENCDTDCHWECDEHDPETGDCIDWDCVIPDCSGNACPWGAISNKVTKIQNLYNEIEARKDVIDTEIAKRASYIAVLEVIREKLAECVTPALEEISEPELKEVRVLYTCQEAQYEHALPSWKEECDYPINFVCCHFE